MYDAEGWTREIKGEGDIFKKEDRAFIDALKSGDRSGVLCDYEDGFQTAIPQPLARLYTGHENDPAVLPALGEGESQASQLTAAISLAYCQPAVSAFFNFELVDEHRLVGWQSGLMYASGVWKPSLYAYQQIAAAVTGHKIDCAKVQGAPAPAP